MLIYLCSVTCISAIQSPSKHHYTRRLMKCPLPGGWLEPGRIRQVEEEQGWGINWRREQESDPHCRCRSLRWFRVSSSSTCHAITWHLRPKPKQNRNIFSVSHSLAHLSSPLPLHLYTFLRCDYLPLAPLCQQSPLFWLCWLQQMLWPFSFRFGGWLAGWLAWLWLLWLHFQLRLRRRLA